MLNRLIFILLIASTLFLTTQAFYPSLMSMNSYSTGGRPAYNYGYNDVPIANYEEDSIGKNLIDMVV
uniref:Uncharacterized protein n=1 Tax=Rhabditophanes sp. KR3021 TaxID=114890 RepID=A0AC35TWT6_9BILA